MKTILIAVDESDCAKNAAFWAVSALVDTADATTIHIAGVTPPIDVSPIAPVGAGTSVIAVSDAIGRQIQVERERVTNFLEELKQTLLESFSSSIAESQITTDVLTAAGGASGVAESIVALTKRLSPDIVVVGSRGMGSVKKAMAGLIGLGSVSDYLLHHIHGTPVCVVHEKLEKPEAKEKRKILVAVDDSDISKKAEVWALEKVVRKDDEVHLVAVALPVPYVAGIQMPWNTTAKKCCSPGDIEAEYREALAGAQTIVAQAAEVAETYEPHTSKIAEDDASASHLLQQEEMRGKIKTAMDYAEKEAGEAASRATKDLKIEESRIFFKALEPEGGAGDVGESIRKYAIQNNIDIAIFGSRDMGGFKRAILSFLGMGSVSDWAAHHLQCPVIVVKPSKEGGENKKD